MFKYITSQIKEELNNASQHKLGERVPEETWEPYLCEQAENCAKIQLLSVAHNTPVKVSISSDKINSKGK